MNVFTPYQSPLECAEALWSDKKRFNDAIDGVDKGWLNHPVCLMYKGHEDWLKYYLNCFMAYRVSKKAYNCTDEVGFMLEAEYYSNKADHMRPTFLTTDFCNQHKRRLFCKSPEKYPQFAEYGTSEENWYVIDGQIVKYINGKRIN